MNKSANFAGTYYKTPQINLSWIIDSHMHIQCGYTCALPTLWAQNGLLNFLGDRKKVDFAASATAGGRIQGNPEYTIAKDILKEVKQTYVDPEYLIISSPYQPHVIEQPNRLASAEEYKNGLPLFTPMFVMTMDMEFAHLAGYEGSTIYHVGTYEWNETIPTGFSPITGTTTYKVVRKSETRYYFHLRENGAHPENKGEKVWLSAYEYNRFEKWYTQVKNTERACLENPWSMLPLYHYEPRRWRYFDDGNSNSSYKGGYSAFSDRSWCANDLSYGSWNYPFRKVSFSTTKEKNALFVGFKMYTPLGYKPLDPKCTHIEKFYSRCQQEKIPILAHCSPGGNTTHEAVFYKEYLSPLPRNRFEYKKKDKESYSEFFSENFVHPQAWKPVLDKYRNLKLCLAHFGGDEWQKGLEGSTSNKRSKSHWIRTLIEMIAAWDNQKGGPRYPNLYTDISCFNKKNFDTLKEILRYSVIEYPLIYNQIKRRVLFGTDWYLIRLVVGNPVLGGTTYKEFCTYSKSNLDSVSKTLWIRFTLINPYYFWGLDNEGMLDQLNSAFSDFATQKGDKKLMEQIKNGREQFRKLKNYIKKAEEYVQSVEDTYKPKFVTG